MLSLSSVLENEHKEVQKALNTANLITLRHEKTKQQRITTFKQLCEKYNISFDEKCYYKPNMNLDCRPEQVNYRNLEHVRDFMTFEINRKYFEYCTKNNIKIDSVITLPEHLINHIDDYIEYGEHKTVIKKLAGWYIKHYIDKDGTVYNNCYEKYLKASLKDVRNKQKDGFYGDLLLNTIRNNIENNKGKFKIRRITFPSIHTGYVKRFSYIKPNNKDKFKNVINKFRNLKGTKKFNQLFERQKRVWIQLQLAERVIRLLPDKYWYKLDVEINDKACLKFGEGKAYRPYYIADRGNILHASIKFSAIMHEWIHGIELNNCRYLKGTISAVACNLLYEMTKGSPILEYKDWIKYRYKPVTCDSPDKYSRYITKIHGDKEFYTNNNEVLAKIFDGYLLKDIGFRNNKFINMKTNTEEKLSVLIAENFDKLCKLDIRLGALTLALFNGEL